MQGQTTIRTLILEYLQQARLLQIATAVNNQPWACTVYFAFDDTLNLYWLSKADRRHSVEIRANEKVAGTVVLPHTPGDKVRGIQFEGIAKELSDLEEVQQALDCYAARMKMPAERVQKILNKEDAHLCYMVAPTMIVLFDELHFPEEPRQEYRILY